VSDIEYTVAEKVATIRLNRPERRNAFTLAMVDEWAELVRRARADRDVRVIVITGAGSAFCAGADLGEIFEEDPAPLSRKDRLVNHIHQVALEINRTDKPVIAAVNGPAVGAGMDMALTCDLRIASRKAFFAASYIRVGVMPGNGAAWYLPQLASKSVALDLLLTGRKVDAEEALRLGLVNRLADDDGWEQAVAEFASSLAVHPPRLTEMVKRTVRYSAGATSLEGALDLVSSAAAIVQNSRALLDG
jgi:enoyl-CoA hydratase/carnithine racemase